MKFRSDPGIVHGYRSGLEDSVAQQLDSLGLEVHYEPCRFKWEPIQKVRRYTPDFILPNGIVIETKGRFISADRQKHRALQQLYPSMDLRFVFSNPRSRLSKTSRTTYADWCDKYGFQWAGKTVPDSWVNEDTCSIRWSAIEEAKIK